MTDYHIGYSGTMCFLWCPEHGTFWSENRTDKCHCGFQTNEEEMMTEEQDKEAAESHIMVLEERIDELEDFLRDIRDDNPYNIIYDRINRMLYEGTKTG